MIDQFFTWLRARKVANEKAMIARTFNDLYTYRVPYRKTTDRLPGSFYGMPHSTGYAWMCPSCNTIHHPYEDSVFSGLQYPACCTHGDGHRLDDDIRTR